MPHTRNFRHPNLVQLYGVCTKERPIFIVTELMSNGWLMKHVAVLYSLVFSFTGCLLDFLRNNPSLKSKPDVIHSMCTQVSSAMFFLEKHGFIHRDLVRLRRKKSFCLSPDLSTSTVCDRRRATVWLATTTL
jgi:tyrosine-protein kinase Tec